MTRYIVRCAGAGILAAAAVAALHGQREWTTSGFDAQRSAWLRADARLTRKSVESGEFKFLWKMKFDGGTRQLNSLTTPIILDRLIGYRGFKALAFFGGPDDKVFAIDTDLARPYWTTVLNYTAATGGQPPSSAECPGGLIATLTRRTTLAPAPAPAPPASGRAGVRNGSAVGEPGKGAAVLSQVQPQRGGRGAAPGPVEGRRNVAPVPFGGVDPVFAMGSDGYVHTLLSSNGTDAETPFPFLPPDAKPSSLIWVDGIVYTTSSDGCGGVPNAVWAVDLTVPAKERRVVSWKTGGPNIAGSGGVAFGADGTLYVAVRQPSSTEAGSHASSIVALDRDSLQVKDWFTAAGADFNVTPVVIRYKDEDLVAATANDGRLYLLQGRSLGGSDHKTPLAVTRRFTSATGDAGLATFESDGTQWILATAGPATADVKFAANGLAPNGRVVAFKLTEAGGALAVTPAWQSRDLASPLAPIVVNGMVFVASSGEYRGRPATLSAPQRAKRSMPAVLYVLDGASGKTLWSSGTRITSFARSGLSAGGGQVYLVTFDGHVYAFGIPMEH